MTYFVYILASRRNGTLYVGVTNDLVRRVYEHRAGLAASFTKKHKVHRLVYFEAHCDVEAAIIREKRFKRWRRMWKINLIESRNPMWRDLWTDIANEAPAGPCLRTQQIGRSRTMRSNPQHQHNYLSSRPRA